MKPGTSLIMTQRDPRLPSGVPRLGDKVRFIPGANFGQSSGFPDELRSEVTGTIVEIHAKHRWYRVEYTAGERGDIGTECFKF